MLRWMSISAVTLISLGCPDETPRDASLRSCQYDPQCLWDEFCGPNRLCRLIDGCTSDVDCNAGKACDDPLGCFYCEIEGSCLPRTTCNSKVDCGIGRVCVAGSCRLDRPCFTALDCDAGERCGGDGYCEALAGCSVHTDCPLGSSCDTDGVCKVVGACLTNSECGAGFYCAGRIESEDPESKEVIPGYCYHDVTCTTDVECAPGTYCYFAQDPENASQLADENSCKDTFQWCSSAAGCPTGAFCDGALCRLGACTNHYSCAAGFLCDLEIGSCVKASGASSE